MANSFVTNLYPKPTGGVLLRTMTVNSTSDSHSLINSGSDDTSGTILQGGATAAGFNSVTKYIVIDVQDADCFVSYSGTEPDSTSGHRLYAGRSYTWSKDAAQKALFVATGSTPSVVQASEFTD